MTIKKQIEIATVILNTGLVKNVFHSCQLLKDENSQTLYPAYPIGAEYSYAGIDDTKGLFAYIRTSGDIISVPLKLQSCSHSYTMTAPMRVVFFNDNEDRNQEELIRQLGTFTFLQGVSLTRIIVDKYRLVREESQLFRERFDGKTFYAAFDVIVTFILLPSDCETDTCIVHPNPLKTCLAAAPPFTDSATSLSASQI